MKAVGELQPKLSNWTLERGSTNDDELGSKPQEPVKDGVYQHLIGGGRKRKKLPTPFLDGDFK